MSQPAQSPGGRTWEFFYPCLHLKDAFGCTIASHVRVVTARRAAILHILFYFINADSFLFLCVCFLTVSRGVGSGVAESLDKCCCHTELVGLWQWVLHEVWLLYGEAPFVCGHVTACNPVFQKTELIARVSNLKKRNLSWIRDFYILCWETDEIESSLSMSKVLLGS